MNAIERDTISGFTMMEVVLALAIISLIATLALPVAQTRGGSHALYLKAQEIQILFRNGRNATTWSKKPAVFEIKTEDRTIRKLDGSEKIVWDAPISISFFPTDKIKFHPDGSASSSRVVLKRLDSTVTLQINEVTGAVLNEGATQGGPFSEK